MRNLFRKENEQTWCLRWGTVGLLLVILVCGGHCGYAKHRYQNTEKVPTMVNTIGPYNNPSETYDFYSLPFCQPPKNVQHRHASLGEKLEGDHLEQSLYDIRFQVEIQWQALCTVHVLKEEVDAFRKAIMERYQYEILIDDVPVEGFVGEILPDQKVARLYTHVDFLIYYNQDRVISARLTTDENRAVPFSRDEMEIEFSYSVTWVHTDVAFANRKNFNEDKSMFPHAFEIHWLSIINSVVLVVLLTGFVSVILYRIVKSDYSRYSKAQDTGEEDYGWKLVHGDVFRPPPQTGLYCALIGLGAQFMLFILFGLMMSVAEIVSPSMPGGGIYIIAIVMFSLTSVVAGFVSCGLYQHLSADSNWTHNVIYTVTLFAVPFLIITIILNVIAAQHSTTFALPFSSIILVVAVYAFLGVPLALVGGVAGRHYFPSLEAPCRTNHFPRIIPPTPLYRSLPVQMFIGGFLPFSGIYIELHYLFSSVWGHNSYHLYGILFIVFIILIIVTACITIALTYFQLSIEDHRWWWRSFLSGGSTGIFIFLYAVFFYWKSGMSGDLQASFFFGRTLLVCFMFSIMLGAVGSISSLLFIREIYNNLKLD